MRSSRTLLALSLVLLSATAGAQVPPYDAAALGSQFKLGDFDALENAKNRALASKEMTTEYQWQLSHFYGVVFDEAQKMAIDSESRFRDHMGAWAEAHPKSVTWRIILGTVLTDIGWDRRGGGWARDVTPEGWQGFEKYLTEAWTVLQSARNISREDPQLYASLTTIAMGLGRDPAHGGSVPFGSLVETLRRSMAGVPMLAPDQKPLYEEIFLEALKQEKYYAPLYKQQSINYLERWYGGPGSIERFLARAADLTADKLGDRMYALLAVTVLSYAGEEVFVPEYNLDWTRIKRGFDSILPEYPEAHELRNFYARLACAHEDRDTARIVLASIKQPIPFDFWQSQNRFEYWTRWIDGEIPYPEFTTLEPAILFENTDEVKALIAAGEPVNAKLFMGRSPLLMAVIENNPEIVRILMAAGANPAATSAKGNTPLNEAARLESTDTMKALLDTGADPNMLDGTGWTVLHQIAREGKPLFAPLLLEYGADVNKTIGEGWTPLHVAAQFGRPRMVRFLIDHGANKQAKTGDGKTALDIAESKKNAEVTAMLR